jgi:uncharacterized phiE125 gp8 family phage protein
MSYRLIEPPSTEPISLQEAKEHLRVDGDEENSLINSLIITARDFVEKRTGRALVTQKIELTLDEWPANEIILPMPPVQSIDSIVYKDKNNIEHVLDSSGYFSDLDSEPARIVPNESWPSVELYPVGAIKVRYTAGYDTASVPTSLKQAMLLLIGTWYENREAVLVGNTANQIPFTVDALIWPYRMFRW